MNSSPHVSVRPQILCTPHCRYKIVGNRPRTRADSPGFADAVYNSFLDTIIQSLFDQTGNVADYIHVGRTLWPEYIAPLHPNVVATTTESVRRQTDAETQRSLLSHLDQNIIPRLRLLLKQNIGVMDDLADRTVAMPICTKFLFLAVYLCQTNRPEKDKKLFSVQTNGKRSRRASFGEIDESDNVVDSLRSLKPRTFPTERLYSLYVSVVNLNLSTCFTSNANADDRLDSLGNLAFYRSLSHFLDIGVLHDYPNLLPTESVQLTKQRMFWGTVTKQEAESIAESISFPLNQYTL